MTQTLDRTRPAGAGPPTARRPRALAALWKRRSPRVLGVVFLCLLLVAVWLTYAMFTKQFADYEEVTLRAERTGLQLPQRADVKIRGVLVGEVLDQRATADGAELTLGIYPEQLDTIPADVTGAILPKTLFGQKYVALQVPEDGEATDATDATDGVEGAGGGEAIRAGAVIERSEVSIEVQQVLDDIYPLLRAIQPADLNYTLNALATALEGRGDQLGETLVTLDDYLRKLNPEIPLLVEDLRKLSRVSDVYSDVLPQVAQILRDTIHVTGTLEDREQQLNTMLTDVTAFAETTDDFLTANGDTLIRLGEVSAPVVDTLARYSPEFPCLLGGLNNLRGRVAEAFRNYTLHIDLEMLPRQPRAYTPADAPRFGADNGPTCGHLPTPAGSQRNPLTVIPNLDDGVDEPTGKGTMRAGVGGGLGGGFSELGAPSGASYVGTPAEREVLNTLMAPGMGMTAEQVPDVGALLIGPVARGAEVSWQ